MGLPSSASRSAVRWVVPNVVGGLVFIASSIGFAWWSGFGLLPFVALFVVPIAAGLQCALAWFTRENVRSTWMGSVVIWVIPCLFVGWTSYEWQRPERIFTHVTTLPLPDGVTNLKARLVVGIEARGWIHFAATEATKRDLISKADLVPGAQLNSRGAAFLMDYGSDTPMRNNELSEPLKHPVAYRAGVGLKTSSVRESPFEHAVWVIDHDGSGVWIVF